MTTIVFDSKILAADSQRSRSTGTGDHARHCPSCKEEIHMTAGFVEKLRVPSKPVKFRDERIIAVATAGAVNVTAPVAHALFAGLDLEPSFALIKASFTEASGMPGGTVVILTKTKFYEIKSTQKQGFTIKEITKFPYTAGTGSQVARVGMDMLGLNAAQAVQLARQYDKATGGEVRYIARRGGVESIGVDAKIETNFSRGE